jgi:hypothetical protein
MEEATKIIVEQAWNWGDTLNMISSLTMAIFTIVIAFFSFLVWKIYKQILFVTSAAEAHSDMMLKLKAIDMDIPIFWWDPTIEDPPVGWKHRKEIELDQIRFYIQEELRKKKKKVRLKLGD